MARDLWTRARERVRARAMRARRGGASTARVETGLDVVARRPSLLRGLRVGLVAHPASVDRDDRHAVAVFRDLSGVKLARLFSPEHGLWGAAQDHARVPRADDPLTGLPVFSLYGPRREPTPAMLRGLDALVIDLQDVGSRYYTYIWTAALAMRQCARARVRVVILDRPNPLGGVTLEGNVPDPRFASFVGLYPLLIRHGLTIGEVASYLNAEHDLGCDLAVVAMRGWRRAMRWEDTGVPWVAPSPNMPTPDTARVYPGGCLLEGTNLSEGRGTTRPFEWLGAPYLDAHRYADRLNRLALPGVHFRPARFIPTFHKWAGRLCGGVQVHVTDASSFRPYLTGIAEIAVARALAPRAFRWKRPPYEFEHRLLPIDLLFGTDTIRRQLERGVSLRAIEATWRADVATWRRRRRPYLLYT